MTTEELNEVRHLTAKIKREEERLQRLKDWITRLTRELDGMPHNNTFPQSSIEDLTVQIVDCEANIQRLILERMASKSRLIKAIDSAVADNDVKSVLIERYGFERSYSDISQLMYSSESRIFALHKKGLKTLGIKGK